LGQRSTLSQYSVIRKSVDTCGSAAFGSPSGNVQGDIKPENGHR
jgi:hypothetical protein